MKFAILAAFAALTVLANSAYAEPVPVQQKIPLVCLSEDGNIGVEGIPDDGEITLIYGTKVAMYIEDQYMRVSMSNNLYDRKPTETAKFTMSAKLDRSLLTKTLSKTKGRPSLSTTYVSVDLVQLVDTVIAPIGFSAVFYAYVSGYVPGTTTDEAIPTTLVRCEYSTIIK